ncbi:MAG: DUF975 family protein [Treponema sp.]|jgi:uncharacterized membrane protein|nr:DUF975 family protein [Treponema sp.]
MNYDILQPNKVLRSYAREQLHGVWKKTAFVFFVIFLIFVPFYIGSVLNQLYPDAAAFLICYTVLFIVAIIISGPLYLGYYGYFLKRIRGEAVSIKVVFDGFKQFSRAFALMLLTIVFAFLWTLLLIIPGIIKSLSYSMAFFVLYDNPNMKPRQALKESIRMMKGYKGKYLGLNLSFIGWVLLGLLTLGIGYLWLYPYMYMTIANFYENIKISQKEMAGEEQ